MITIKRIANEDVPYDLLFLADENDEQISKYKDVAVFWGAKVDGEIVGILGLTEIHEQASEIVNIAVAEKFENRRIATKLIQEAIAYSKEKPYREIVIKTGNCGIKQLYLYQRCGFRFDAINKNYIAEHYPMPIFENDIQCLDQIVLKKTLVSDPASSSENGAD